MPLNNAESEKPGACHIDLPCNIAAMPVESEVGRQPLKHHKPNLEMASIESLEEAAGLLFQAKTSSDPCRTFCYPK